LVQDFTGAGGISAVNSLVIKRALPPLLGFLSFCLPLSAQQPDQNAAANTGSMLSQPNVFSTVDGPALIHSLPMLTLLEGQPFPVSSSLGRLELAPLDPLPVAFQRATATQRVNIAMTSKMDAPSGVTDLPLSQNYYAGGEVGVLYGRSSGKYARDDFQTYIVGGVGNDKFNITAGASYEESSGRIPRFGR
jgi:hypothetical protein